MKIQLNSCEKITHETLKEMLHKKALHCLSDILSNTADLYKIINNACTMAVRVYPYPAQEQWRRERGDMGECPPLGDEKILRPKPTSHLLF